MAFGRTPVVTTPKEIRAALDAYYEQCVKDGTVPEDQTHHLYRLLEDRMNMEAKYAKLEKYNQYPAAQHFKVQCLNELNRRANVGMLIKRGARNDLHFYTPAAAKAADAEALDRAAKAEARREENKDLHRRLQALGLNPSGITPQLSIGDWRKIIVLAERGWEFSKIRGAE